MSPWTHGPGKKEAGRGGEGGRKAFPYSRLLTSKERMMEMGMGRGNHHSATFQ